MLHDVQRCSTMFNQLQAQLMYIAKLYCYMTLFIASILRSEVGNRETSAETSLIGPIHPAEGADAISLNLRMLRNGWLRVQSDLERRNMNKGSGVTNAD
jgi:hypothetical protein